jgi:hypothetical protein
VLATAVAHLAGHQQLAAPQLLRAPKDVVPEVAGQLLERRLSRRSRGRSAGRLEVVQADAVVHDAKAAAKHGVCLGRRRFGDWCGQDREVDFEPVLKEHAALLEAPDRRRLEQRQQRLAERTHPRAVAQVTLRIIDEEPEVNVGKLIRRRVRSRLRADQENRANIRLGARPGGYLIE